jgi:hypothetical protein
MRRVAIVCMLWTVGVLAAAPAHADVFETHPRDMVTVTCPSGGDFIFGSVQFFRQSGALISTVQLVDNGSSGTASAPPSARYYQISSLECYERVGPTDVTLGPGESQTFLCPDVTHYWWDLGGQLITIVSGSPESLTYSRVNDDQGIRVENLSNTETLILQVQGLCRLRV